MEHYSNSVGLMIKIMNFLTDNISSLVTENASYLKKLEPTINFNEMTKKINGAQSSFSFKNYFTLSN